MSTPCEQLERWLTEDGPAGEEAGHQAHAAGCARCRSRLAAALEVDRALSAALRAPPPGRAPDGFAAGVMARVRAAEQAQPLPARSGAAAPAEAQAAAAAERALVRRVRVGLGATWLLAGLPVAVVTALAFGSIRAGLREEAARAALATGADGAVVLAGWLSGWAAGLETVAPGPLALGALAAAALATWGGLALARATVALAGRRALA